MITLEIKARTIHLSQDEQSLATGANTREVFRDRFRAKIAAKTSFIPVVTLTIDESTLKRMIGKYSEQLIYQPLNELRFWFAYSSGIFVEPGYPPLFYSKNKGKAVSPNKSAVAATGEGLAGLIAQRLYRCRKLARPNHDYPDVVMEADKRTYLVESKATIGTNDSSILQQIEDELPRFASFAASCAQLDVRPITALLVGSVVRSESLYLSLVTEIIPS